MKFHNDFRIQAKRYIFAREIHYFGLRSIVPVLAARAMLSQAKALRFYDMINHHFKYKYMRECRFHELAWMTIKNKVYYNKDRLVGEAEPVQAQPPSQSVVVRRGQAA